MPISETGHAKNIANFNQVIQFCIGYGTPYTPSNPLLLTTALTPQHANALALHNAIDTAKQPFINAVNQRQIRYADLPSFSTRIVNALAASSGVSQQLVDDATTILRKIRGDRAKKLNPDNENSISVSQRSFDMLQDHFVELIALVSATPTYTPNEPSLQVPALTIAKTQALALNQAVVTATVALANARKLRNEALYAEVVGVLPTVKLIKTYVKSAFGARSVEYKQISGFRFSYPR